MGPEVNWVQHRQQLAVSAAPPGLFEHDPPPYHWLKPIRVPEAEREPIFDRDVVELVGPM